MPLTDAANNGKVTHNGRAGTALMLREFFGRSRIQAAAKSQRYHLEISYQLVAINARSAKKIALSQPLSNKSVMGQK